MESLARVERFSIDQALKEGWDIARANWGLLIGLVLLMGLIPAGVSLGFHFISNNVESMPLQTIVRFSGSIIHLLLNLLFATGVIKITLSLVDRKPGQFTDLLDCGRYMFYYLVSSTLYSLIVFVGILLFIIPGIIWAIQFQFFGFFIVDENAGPIEALRRSSAVTKGAKWTLLGFDLLTVAINIIGVLCLVIGVFFTSAITMAATASAFRQLQNPTSDKRAMGDKPPSPISNL